MFLRVLLASLALCFSLTSYAETKIAVVDSQAVSLESNQYKAFEKKAEERFGKKRAELTKLREKLQKDGRQLQADAQSGLLSQQELQSRKLALQQIELKLNGEGKIYNESLQALRQQYLTGLKGDIEKALMKVVEREKYDLVVDRRSIIYLANEVDITTDVIQELNAKKKK